MLLKPIILTCDHPECKERHEFETPRDGPYNDFKILNKFNFSIFTAKDKLGLLYICSHHSDIYNDDDKYTRYYPVCKGEE